MQNLGVKLAFLAMIAGLYPSLEAALCQQLYHRLGAGSAPRGADVIVVLGGGSGRRIHKGLDLLAQGFAPRIVFLGTGPEMGFAFQQARQVRKWASGRICFGDRPVRNTTDGVRHLHEWAARRGVKRCLVVSDANHLGRVAAQLAHFENGSLQTHLVATGTPPRLDDTRSRWHVLREASAYALVRLGKALEPHQGLGLSSAAYML